MHDRGPIPIQDSQFGRYLDLSRHLPPRTSSIVLARQRYGLQPIGVSLPHQVYLERLDPGTEYAVLPVLSPWLYITGKNAGMALHPQDDPYGDLLDKVDELEQTEVGR